MPIDFQVGRVEFPSKRGEAPFGRDAFFVFPTNIRNAQVALQGFDIQFTRDDRPFHQKSIRLEHTVFENQVNVNVRFALRDFSGNFDDPFEGFVDVAVIVDRL